MPGFTQARQWVILCAEEMGYQKIVPRDPTAHHDSLCQWAKEMSAVAFCSGQTLLLAACQEYARELGTTLPTIVR